VSLMNSVVSVPGIGYPRRRLPFGILEHKKFHGESAIHPEPAQRFGMCGRLTVWNLERAQ